MDAVLGGGGHILSVRFIRGETDTSGICNDFRVGVLTRAR